MCKNPWCESGFNPDGFPCSQCKPAPRTPEDSNANGSGGVSGGNPRPLAPLPEDDGEICTRLLSACTGHPHALIPWPHRLLHDAVSRISDLTRRLAEAEAERDNAAYLLMRAAPLTIKANARAEAAEARVAEAEAWALQSDAIHVADTQRYLARADDAEARVRELREDMEKLQGIFNEATDVLRRETPNARTFQEASDAQDMIKVFDALKRITQAALAATGVPHA